MPIKMASILVDFNLPQQNLIVINTENLSIFGITVGSEIIQIVNIPQRGDYQYFFMRKLQLF